ncbi:hypothetical protein H4C45_21010 [Pseudomonas monteilii]|nr:MULTISPECIES: beta-ketoacyl synthase N-terminal-like domain-containing protein [Pseudomonas]MBA6104663.1 hypothetical protein [Pseudomonas monteilii]
MSTQNTKRIVVTGIGIVGPLGCGAETTWTRLLAGKSGIRVLPGDLADGTGTSHQREKVKHFYIIF